MRKKVIAGNWKMNKDVFETAELIEGLKESIKTSGTEVIVCPPYTRWSLRNKFSKGAA